MSRSPEVDPAQPLSQCPELPVNNKMPSPLNERLDQLVDIANESGTRTNRKEVLASLVLAAPEDGDKLMREVIAYRRATAADAAVRGRDPKSVLVVRRHPRGPRRHAGA